MIYIIKYEHECLESDEVYDVYYGCYSCIDSVWNDLIKLYDTDTEFKYKNYKIETLVETFEGKYSSISIQQINKNMIENKKLKSLIF